FAASDTRGLGGTFITSPYVDALGRTVTWVDPPAFLGPAFLKYLDQTDFENMHQRVWQGQSNNWIVLRYADVLLMYAEAVNEGGAPVPAMTAEQALNAVRTRAGIGAVLGLSTAAFRDSVWLERRREFLFEGQRWFDLSRWGVLNSVITAKTTELGTIAPGETTVHVARSNLLPIPQGERYKNTNLTQHPAPLQELFGPSPGLGLSFTRLTIGASDFSLHQYSYDDMPAGQTDSSLAHFSNDSNQAYVLPTVQRALAINPQLKIMASPWSPPGWMKTTGSLIQGTLLPEAYGPFAEYFRSYIEAYRAEGVPIYAITVQNEPHYEPAEYPGMLLDPPVRALLIGQYLGPLFARSGIGTIILDWDHNWDAPQSPLQVLSDSAAASDTAGVAWDCYAGDVSAQTMVHDAHPDKDTYFTECSGGEWAPNFADHPKWIVRTLG